MLDDTTIERVLFTETEIATRVADLGQQISRDYAGRRLLVVGVLTGASVFLCDLIRQIKLPLAIDFMTVSSYGAATRSSGVVRILKDLEAPLAGKDVLLIEDIVDTGLTLSYLLDNLHARQPASLRSCSFLDKPERRLRPVSVDYIGFSIPNAFVVGYGLDYNQLYRNLPYVGVLRPLAEAAGPG
jgi:hypoxanthine phosphoribosyltransferase